MSIGLVGKLALLGAMVITSMWGDGGAVPEGGCPFKDAFSCCVYECQHDPGSGCTTTRCCETLCR